MNPVVVIAAIVGALIGGGGVGGYLGTRRAALASELAAATSKPHEQLTAETDAFKVFMAEARVQHLELAARLAACEAKHAAAEAERITQVTVIDALRARIAHLEEAVQNASKSLGAHQQPE